MTLDRIVVVALVTRAGEVLLRTRDERSAVRPNRWSLPGGGAEEGEDPVDAGIRIVREQTGLTIAAPMRLIWHGRMSQPLAEVYFYARSTTATVRDLPADPVPGAPARFGDYELAFIPGDQVMGGRSFTPVSGYVLGDFLSSRHYRELMR